jgi:hypothetical protein
MTNRAAAIAAQKTLVAPNQIAAMNHDCVASCKYGKLWASASVLRMAGVTTWLNQPRSHAPEK